MFCISVIRDINTIIHSSLATWEVTRDGSILVYDEYFSKDNKKHNVIVKFVGDGVVHIYDAATADKSNLDNSDYVLYDSHWDMHGNPSDGYRKKLKELFKE